MNSPAPIPDSARGDWIACGLVLALAAWIYGLGVMAAQPGLTSPTPTSYYAWQTEAFRLGQLHLPIPVDPRLLELENPYAGPQGANRPHDMCFYDGKFYLHYGVTPVLLVYLPWRLLTGTFLGEMAGMSVLLWIGLAAGSVWLTAVKRRFFPAVSPLWLAGILLTIAFGSPLFLLAQNNTFYAVPIAGAFACLAVALLCLDRALTVRAGGPQAGWLAAASLSWGFAAGSRPIYVFGLAFLGFAALWLWWKTGLPQRRSWPGLRLLVGAILPAALVGTGLLLYNYLRFDDPFDFGMRYTLQAVDLRDMRLMGPEFIRPNLHAYLLREVTWMRYFPFFAPGDGLYGLLRYAPWLGLAALFPLFAWVRPLRDQRWFWGLFVAGGAVAANFAFLTYFVGDAPRYLIDFAPQWFFVASAAALPLLGLVAAPRCPRAVRLGVQGALLGALAVSLFNGAMLGLSRHGDRERVLRIARVLNQPTAWWESWRAEPHGPMRLQVRFPTNRDSGVEPLLATGGIGGNGDIVTVTYLPKHQVKLGYFHLGIGGPQSEPVTYIPGAIHEIEVTAGGLFPPPAHPRLRDRSAAEIGRLRRQLRITFDGETLLGGSAASYPSSPGLVRLGENHTVGNVSDPRFTGEILSARRLGIERIEAPFPLAGPGPVRLRVILPDLPDGPGLPLVSTGVTGAGDLVSIRITGPGRAVLTHDNWGSPAARSEEFSFVPDKTQTITVEMGSLYAPDTELTDPSLRDRLRLTFNDRTVYDFDRKFYPSTSEQVEIGYNAIAADAVTAGFTGRIVEVETVPPAPPPAAPGWGPVRLTLRFPRELPAAVEPLLITGETGRADVLFVRYGPDRTIQFGFDHWGVGGALSDPIAIDTADVHQIEVRMASLFPSDSPQAAGPTEIRLNGELVFTPPFVAYDNPAGEITVARNDIGASSCAALFSGQIMVVERLSD